MRAFNRRLEPKELAGMPLVAAICLVLSLISVAIIFVVPGVFKVIPVFFLVASLVAAVCAFIFREQLPFLLVIYLGRFVEKGRVSTESRTKF